MYLTVCFAQIERAILYYVNIYTHRHGSPIVFHMMEITEIHSHSSSDEIHIIEALQYISSNKNN